MRLVSTSTLVLAAVLASPALWQALVVGDLELEDALIRYLVAVLVAAVMIALLRGVTKPYQERQAEKRRLAERAEREESARNKPDAA